MRFLHLPEHRFPAGKHGRNSAGNVQLPVPGHGCSSVPVRWTGHRPVWEFPGRRIFNIFCFAYQLWKILRAISITSLFTDANQRQVPPSSCTGHWRSCQQCRIPGGRTECLRWTVLQCQRLRFSNFYPYTSPKVITGTAYLSGYRGVYPPSVQKCNQLHLAAVNGCFDLFCRVSAQFNRLSPTLQ